MMGNQMVESVENKISSFQKLYLDPVRQMRDERQEELIESVQNLDLDTIWICLSKGEINLLEEIFPSPILIEKLNEASKDKKLFVISTDGEVEVEKNLYNDSFPLWFLITAIFSESEEDSLRVKVHGQINKILGFEACGYNKKEIPEGVKKSRGIPKMGSNEEHFGETTRLLFDNLQELTKKAIEEKKSK